MILLENRTLQIAVKEMGAELTRLFHKPTKREYLWQGGPAWPRQSPILFPAIDGFVQGTYLWNGHPYQMPPHGFARDLPFSLYRQTEEQVTLCLESSVQTHALYPFDFKLFVSYRLSGNRLRVEWTVKNTGEHTMYYAIGGHPGFRLDRGTALTDYALTFDRPVRLAARRMDGRLVSRSTYPIAEKSDHLPLSPTLLENDSLAFESGIRTVTLENPRTGYRLQMDLTGAPILAVWTDPETVQHAEFLCIEPWYGIGDFTGEAPQEISQHYLEQKLSKNTSWVGGYLLYVGNEGIF